MKLETNFLSFALALTIFTVGGALLGGWLLMLTVGVIHGEWLHGMPTIGYWSAVKVSAMLSIMTGVAIGGARGTE